MVNCGGLSAQFFIDGKDCRRCQKLWPLDSDIEVSTVEHSVHCEFTLPYNLSVGQTFTNVGPLLYTHQVCTANSSGRKSTHAYFWPWDDLFMC